MDTSEPPLCQLLSLSIATGSCFFEREGVTFRLDVVGDSMGPASGAGIRAIYQEFGQVPHVGAFSDIDELRRFVETEYLRFKKREAYAALFSGQLRGEIRRATLELLDDEEFAPILLTVPDIEAIAAIVQRRPLFECFADAVIARRENVLQFIEAAPGLRSELVTAVDESVLGDERWWRLKEMVSTPEWSRILSIDERRSRDEEWAGESAGDSAQPIRICVSLTHSADEIASALSEAFGDLFGGAVELRLSPSQGQGRGSPVGGLWFNWLMEQAACCQTALVLVTPDSVGSPWTAFEAGAFCGAAVREGVGGLREVHPLLFDVDDDAIPEALRASNAPAKRGDDAEDMERFLGAFASMYVDQLGSRRVKEGIRRMHKVVAHYVERVGVALHRRREPRQPGQQPPERRVRTLAGESLRAVAPGLVGKLLNNLTAPRLLDVLGEMLRLERQNSYKLASLNRVVQALVRGNRPLGQEPRGDGPVAGFGPS